MQNNFDLTISKRVENLNSKLALYKVKNILLKEFKNPYYKNAANVKEMIKFNLYPVCIRTENYTHVEHLTIYNNGFYFLSSCNYRIHSMPGISRNVIKIKR